MSGVSARGPAGAGGRTLREAARSKSLRPQVVSLLKGLENMAERQRQAGCSAYDSGWMWAELGSTAHDDCRDNSSRGVECRRAAGEGRAAGGLVAKKGRGVKRPAKGRVAEPPKTAASELANPSRADWRVALRDFSARVRTAYGSRLSRVILYGSRARGDAEWDSDVDVVVVLNGYDDFWVETDTLSTLSGEILRDHGVVLSAMPASVKELEQSEKLIFRDIRREGVPAP